MGQRRQLKTDQKSVDDIKKRSIELKMRWSQKKAQSCRASTAEMVPIISLV